MKLERELLRGAGPAAVLAQLAIGEAYGYELVQALDRKTDGVLAMGHSTLYPMLYHLEAKKLIASREKVVNGRTRRYYRLTAKGKRRLDADRQQLAALNGALAQLGLIQPGSA